MLTDKLIGRDVRDYHLIVTSHPYMIELGLGTSTTGTLYNWWNRQNDAGAYLNRMSINSTRDIEELADPPNTLGALLGISDSTQFFWNGWKPNRDLQNAGRYLEQDLSAYLNGFGGNHPWTYTSAYGPVTIDDIITPDYGHPVIGGKLDDDLNFQPELGTADSRLMGSLSPVYDIVDLNRYMSSFEDYNSRGLWDKDETTIAGQDTKSLYASHELLTEIKSSKLGSYIEWSGEVTFNTNDGGLFCPITEWIPFKLYLFDRPHSDVSDKTVTIKSLKYAAPRRDVNGKLFNTRVDGGYTDYNPANTASQGVGDLDLHTNPVTKKWESGSPVLFAKMTTSVGYPTVPTVDHLETNNIQEDLDSEDFETVKFIPASGTAMPIRPQNGNPLQWQPNYLRPDDVRCVDEDNIDYDKETLSVYNFSTQRKFDRGEEVMLTRIDGVWHISALGTNTGDIEEVAGSVNRWGEFTYMMTNADYFFRNTDGASFAPRDAEQFFHKLYYEELNDGVNTGLDYGLDGGWDINQTFNTANVMDVYLNHGYAQTTSFDYLDSTLFGIRSKDGIGGDDFKDLCSIATTSALETAGGVSIPPPNADVNARNAAHAGVFFGCVFPGGYTGASTYLEDRPWDTKVKSSGTLPTVVASNYINTETNNSTERIFAAGDGTSHRNNCRQPAGAEPFDQISAGDNRWSRADSRHSANIFAKDRNTNSAILASVPADVMTNASPTGKNGSPLYPVHRFKDMHVEGADVKLLAGKAFLHGMWLGKNGTAGSTFDDSDSAFDFSPISRNKLMFRPLKMEAYIQFGVNNNSPDKDIARDLSQTVSQQRVGFCSEARRTQLDSNRPATSFFEDREQGEAPDLWSNDGLRWGGDVTQDIRYYNLHEFDYWDNNLGPTKWSNNVNEPLGNGNWKGAKAFGVITTFNTVTANSQIDITTDNIYGMGAASHGDFTLAGGYTNQDRTWGVSSFIDSYKQENIIDLSLRVYHQHPRDQTLYDPRTFAVHHFNPDVRLRGGDFLGDDGVPKQLDPFRPLQTQQNIKEGAVLGGGSVEYDYNYEETRSEVDIRVISRHAKHIDHELPGLEANDLYENDQPPYEAVKLGVGEYVLSDVTLLGDTRKPPVIASKFWRIDDVRVGKLLPFRYNTLEVGIPTPENVPFTLVSETYSRSHTGLDASTPDIKDMMIIKDLGTGYANGDIVGLNSRGVQFKLTVLPIVGIVGMECLSRGSGITASQVASYGDTFKQGEDGPLEITTLESVAGTGFDAYFVAGKVYEKLNTDPKPYLMKRDGEEIIRIAADESQGTHLTHGHTSAAEAGAFINESRETTFTLDPALYSANKEYDLFFHFHNDISMTWMSSKEGFFGSSARTHVAPNPSDANEQHITVNINPR